jgi:hypothetical protein
VGFYYNWDKIMPMDCRNREWIQEGISKLISQKFLRRPLSNRKWRLEIKKINEENRWIDKEIRREVDKKV